MDKLGWEVTDDCNVMLKCKVRGKEKNKYNVQRSTLSYCCLDAEGRKELKTVFGFVFPTAYLVEETESTQANHAGVTVDSRRLRQNSFLSSKKQLKN